ncbi:hypothetical protein ACFFX1_55625 [Dactylosporangium sucinum]|uniref:Uncharacterized protein n=1 Tax=Dactylosporangium sucinum TaxID=1424081 RepID=A0A917U1Y0_9ACTN|nr:hypothetical protein [Dactylosporangium sucinum]GGM52333.1 hypothetical protein GCM10007977_062390 [Dactylosporangium sucinum]
MTRVAGHALWYEGAAHDDDGHLIESAGRIVRSGPGRGKCECGALSWVLPSATARKAWHRQHKTEVAAGV